MAVPSANMAEMTFHWNGQDVRLIEIAERQPIKEEVVAVKMKLSNLRTNAQDLYLCENGQILFRVDE